MAAGPGHSAPGWFSWPCRCPVVSRGFWLCKWNHEKQPTTAMISHGVKLQPFYILMGCLLIHNYLLVCSYVVCHNNLDLQSN